MPGYQEILEQYWRMSEEAFRHFATHEAFGLTPEALEALRVEMRRRRCVPDPEATIDVQLRRLSSEEFERMVTRFRALPCPHCGSTAEPLDGVSIERGRDLDLEVGCKACLRRMLRERYIPSIPLEVATALLRPAARFGDMARYDGQMEQLNGPGPTEALRRYVWVSRGEWAHLLKSSAPPPIP